LIFLAIVFDHTNCDKDVWDASILEYNWFTRSGDGGPPPPPKTDVESMPDRQSPPPTLRNNGSSTPASRFQGRPRSSWMGPQSSPESNGGLPLPTIPFEVHTPHSSIKSSRTPKWVKNLAPVRRGMELPFPVQSDNTRPRVGEAPRLDAPAARESFPDPFYFDRNRDSQFD